MEQIETYTTSVDRLDYRLIDIRLIDSLLQFVYFEKVAKSDNTKLVSTIPPDSSILKDTLGNNSNRMTSHPSNR